MLSLTLAVVLVALPDCINPSLIGADLFLVGGQHPARRAVAFAAFTVTLVTGLALALGWAT